MIRVACRTTSLTVAALAAVLILGACGGDDDEPVAAPVTTAVAPAASITTAATTTSAPPTTVSTTTTAPRRTTTTTKPPRRTTTTTSTTTTTTSTTTPPTTTLPTPIPPPLDPESPEPVIEIGRIEIPRLALDRTMYEGIRLTTLDYGPGHWPGTAMPGNQGNVVVAGHRVSHNQDFRYLDQLVPGDQVFFTVGDQRFTYAVDQITIEDDSAVWIVDQTPAHTATLFACHPPGSVEQRIVAHLSLVA